MNGLLQGKNLGRVVKNGEEPPFIFHLMVQHFTLPGDIR